MSEAARLRPPDGPFAPGFYEARRPVQPVAVVRMPDGGHGVAVLHRDGPGVIRLDAAGNVLWSHRYELKTREFSLVAIRNQLVLVGSDGLPSRTAIRPLFLMALGEDGTPGVVRRLASTDGVTFLGTGSVDDDTFWVAGGAEYSTFVLMVNADLNVVSQFGLQASQDQAVRAFASADGDRFAAMGGSGGGCMVALLSGARTPLWTRSFEKVKQCSHIAASGDRIAVVGFDAGREVSRFRILVLDMDGLVVSDKTVAPFSFVHDFKPLDGGGFVIVGQFDTDQSIWIAMLDPNGALQSEHKVSSADVPLYPRLASPVARGVLVQVSDRSLAHLDLFGLDDSDRWSAISDVVTEWESMESAYLEPTLRRFGAELSASVAPAPKVLRLQVARRPDAVVRDPSVSWGQVAELPTGPFDPRSTVVDETEAFGDHVVDLFLREEWQTLDGIVSTAVKSRERFANSSWKTRAIQIALEWRSQGLSDLSEEAYLGRLDAWESAIPGTEHPSLLRASAWQRLSEEGGVDDTDSFRELAFQEYARLGKLNPDNPEFYLQYMGMLESWGESSNAIFREGMKRLPSYYYLYQYKLGFIRPMWGGTQQDVEELVRTMKAGLEPALFDEMYARLVHYVIRWMERDYPELEIDEAAALRGQQSIVREFPKSRRDVYRLGFMACEFGERDLLRSAFSNPALRANRQLIKDEMRSVDEYAICRHWALADFPHTPLGDSNWRGVLFSGHAEFPDKTVADGFLSYTVRIDGQDRGVTALAPLLGSLEADRLFHLAQPTAFSIRNLEGRGRDLSITSIRTLPDDRVPSYAVELELQSEREEGRSLALVPSVEELQLYSPVWIIGPEQPEVAIVMSPGEEAPSGHLLLWTRSKVRSPSLAGAPVVDQDGGVVGTIVGQDETGTLLCETIAWTRGAFENAGKMPDVVFTEPTLPSNAWFLEDLFWEWKDRIPSGTTLCSVDVSTVGVAEMTKMVAQELPDDFVTQLRKTVSRMSYPRGTQFSAFFGVDNDYNLVLAEPPPRPIAAFPSGPPTNFDEMMDPPFEKWKKELGGRVVEFVVDIAESGKVVSCTITTEGIPEGFRDEACSAFMRVVYPPGDPVHMTARLVDN